jgi:RimJ/RimL family protein N-acetyltransferase
MPFGWHGQKTRLVPLEREKHFDNCVRWLNDPLVTAWTLIGDFPLTRLAEQEFFDRVARSSDAEIVFAIELLDEKEEHVGVCGIHNITYRHGVGTIGLIIGRPQLWRRGLGTDAIDVLTHYAFEVAGLRLILSEAMSENIASIKAQQKCGYREIGRIATRYWKRGAYRDAVLFALDREDWQAREAARARPHD